MPLKKSPRFRQFPPIFLYAAQEKRGTIVRSWRFLVLNGVVWKRFKGYFQSEPSNGFSKVPSFPEQVYSVWGSGNRIQEAKTAGEPVWLTRTGCGAEFQGIQEQRVGVGVIPGPQVRGTRGTPEFQGIQEQSASIDVIPGPSAAADEGPGAPKVGAPRASAHRQ